MIGWHDACAWQKNNNNKKSMHYVISLRTRGIKAAMQKKGRSLWRQNNCQQQTSILPRETQHFFKKFFNIILKWSSNENKIKIDIKTSIEHQTPPIFLMRVCKKFVVAGLLSVTMVTMSSNGRKSINFLNFHCELFCWLFFSFNQLVYKMSENSETCLS